MLSFEEVQDALTEIADGLPQEIYQGLNGGVVLLPETKHHPEGQGDDLYILGQYHADPAGLGRYISIYYGSFRLVHGRLFPRAQKDKLRELLYHELTHHLEHMAGNKDLEWQDKADLEDYRRRRNAP